MQNQYWESELLTEQVDAIARQLAKKLRVPDVNALPDYHAVLTAIYEVARPAAKLLFAFEKCHKRRGLAQTSIEKLMSDESILERAEAGEAERQARDALTAYAKSR